jgi:hypothetical protein
VDLTLDSLESAQGSTLDEMRSGEVRALVNNEQLLLLIRCML